MLVNGYLYLQKDDKMRIKEEDIKKMIREALNKKLDSILGENVDYTATKQASLRAQELAFELEQELVKDLNLVAPDHLQDPVRERYAEIMDTMKSQIIGAVSEAIELLRPFPRTQTNNGRR